ncbi:MAG: manganese efflux pump [Clostridiales bacterium]|nr:manganese efflux pump [Clostridiales bacterium]
MTAGFFLQNIGLGAGLAMDASAVSMSNGLNEPKMSIGKKILMAATYAIFQAAMPIAGYFAGHALIDKIGPYIPWIALVLLLFLGGKMIRDGIKERRKKADESAIEGGGAENAEAEAVKPKLGVKTLLVQALATSIDALSVGLSISDYEIYEAMIAAAIISAITFALCMIAVFIGQKFGDKLGYKAVILGGIILIIIGIEICVTGVLGVGF